MGHPPEVLDENSVDPQYRIFFVLRLNDVTYGERTHIATVFKISRIDRVKSLLVKNFSALSPFGERVRRGFRDRSGYELVLVVFLGSPDDAVLHDILHRLNYLRFGKRNVHDQPGAVLDSLFVIAHRAGKNTHRETYKDNGQASTPKSGVAL